MIKTRKTFAQWRDIFPNATCVVSLIDRLVHHSEIIKIDAESYRLKEAKEQSEKQKNLASINQKSLARKLVAFSSLKSTIATT